MKKKIVLASLFVFSLVATAAFFNAKATNDIKSAGIDEGTTRCQFCKGTGFRGNYNCTYCNGTGRNLSY